jgi:peptide/nickel transport system permease protein
MAETAVTAKNIRVAAGEFTANRLLTLGGLAVAFLLLVALAAPFLAPHDPTATSLSSQLQPPSAEYPLGTDNLGRCILSRVIYGTRLSLLVSLTVVFLSAAGGIMAGLLAGCAGGIVDGLVMRAVDIMLSFPSIILALAIIAVFGPGTVNVIAALSLVHWTGYARLARGQVLAVKGKEYVESARAMGNGELSIVARYILPNILSPLLVMATLDIAHVILAAAGLSFLGLGLQPPTPEWGGMVNEGREFIRTAPYITLFPGLALMLAVLAFNLLGDGLRDALDPRLGENRMN